LYKHYPVACPRSLESLLHVVEKKHSFPQCKCPVFKGEICHFCATFCTERICKIPKHSYGPFLSVPICPPLLRHCPSLNSRHWLSQRLTSRLFKNVQYLRMSQKHSQHFYVHTSKMVIERKLHARLHSLCLRHTLKACMHYTHPISHCPNSSSLIMLASSGFTNMKNALRT